MINVAKVIRRYEDMRTERQYYEPRWEEIAKYVAPNKRGIQSKFVQGGKRTQDLYDSTAIYAVNLLASIMSSSITSSALEWFSLKHRLEELNKIQEIVEYLDECGNRMYLAFRQSSLYAETNETIYREMPVFGTGCLQIEEINPASSTFSGFLFKGLPINEYYISEGVFGKIDTLVRKFEISARVAVEKWGEGKVGKKILQASKIKPDEKFEIIHIVFPRPNGSNEEELNTKWKWASAFISLTDKHKIDEGGYKSFPFVVPRWSKYSGEVYGRGPADMALPDISTLNEAIKLGLKALAMTIYPPLKVKDNGVIGNVRLTPGSLNIVKEDGAIEPIQIGSRFDIKNVEVANLQKSIKQILLADQIENLISIDAPRRTATEVQLRWDLMQQLLGSVLTNIESEFLNPLIDRCFDIMYEKGAFPPEPQALLDARQTDPANGREIDVVYESPLAKAQRMNELRALNTIYDMGATIAPVYPAVFDPIDHDIVMQKVGRIVGVPMDIYRRQEEVERIREERDNAQAEAEQNQDALNLAEGLKKIAPLMAGNNGGKREGIQRNLQNISGL